MDRPIVLRIACACLSLISCSFGLVEAPSLVWVEDTFEDFADGRFDAGGQNLFASREGVIRAIHRFDLNQDGYLDLIFNNNHDNYGFIHASLGTVTEDRKIEQSRLAVEGSIRAELADLNKDGYSDVLFCPNAGGVQTGRRFLTIMYGGSDGWSPQRSNGLLPVYDARTMAVVDLNRDRWPDIAVLNGEAWLPGQPSGRILRVFWGGPDGFLMDRRVDMGVSRAVDIAAADLDGDASADLAVLTADGTIRLVWAEDGGNYAQAVDGAAIVLPTDDYHCVVAVDFNRDGQNDLIVGAKSGVYIAPGRGTRAWAPVRSLPDLAARHISMGDLDGDERPDLVLAGPSAPGQGAQRRQDEVRILWGDADGFASSRSSSLPIRSVAATAIGDLDGDGCADLALAISQGSGSYAADSLIFFGGCERRFSTRPVGIRTEGASHAAIVPRGEKTPGRVIFCNSQGGTLNEAVTIQVYWGGARGFEPGRSLEIPFRSGYQARAADLNSDGRADLIVVNSGATSDVSESDPRLGATIFWGGDEGPDIRKRTLLREQNAGSCNVADLDRDGYLDVVLGEYLSKGPELAVIYYGSAQGFDRRQRFLLRAADRPADLGRGWIGPVTVADFNRDEWLDLAVTSSNTDDIRIFWGGPQGFDDSRQSRLLAPGPYGSEAADLNRDGYLDLIVSTYNDYRRPHDTGTLIFWGGGQGFHSWNSQRLPGLWAAGLTVADYDRDGYLDLFCSHYHAELTRESLPSFLFWGGPDGFAGRRRTNLFGDSVHDAFAGDFDQDGRLDLALSCHATDGDHRTFSLVYYNDGNRFRDPRVARLPTHGAHWMWGQDMGHAYDREWRQTYESSVFSWDHARKGGRLDWNAEVPGQTRLAFAIRSSARREEIGGQTWQTIGPGPFAVEPAARYFQYRATFYSDNGDRYPVLDRVTVTLNQ